MMEVSPEVLWGGLATVSHLIAYFLYIKGAIWNQNIAPNEVTWAMWAYGTFVLFWIEWYQGAGWDLLWLPLVDAVLGLIVFGFAWSNLYKRYSAKRISMTESARRMLSSIPRFDWLSFATDVTLSILFGLMTFYFTGDSMVAIVGGVIALMISNATTFTSFAPITRSTWFAPSDESWLPWTIWALSYVFLTIATVYSEGWGLWEAQFYIYPVTNLIMHGLIGLFALGVLQRLFRAK